MTSHIVELQVGENPPDFREQGSQDIGEKRVGTALRISGVTRRLCHRILEASGGKEGKEGKGDKGGQATWPQSQWVY